MENKKFTLDLGSKKIEVENKNIAEQTNGNIMVSCGDTLVLSTCVMGREREDMGFFPLMVDYEEKYYAAGKIKGARYIKREGRPSDEAICTTRIIDRTIRPLFDEGLSSEIQ
ncbi:MAG: polyribonucleotide nucleotidyltransferase, partial [Candidatus Paceibacterota bacterium]